MRTRAMTQAERTMLLRVMGMVGANFQEAMPSAIVWETEIEGLAAQSCWDTLRQNVAIGFENVFGIPRETFLAVSEGEDETVTIPRSQYETLLARPLGEKEA